MTPVLQSYAFGQWSVPVHAHRCPLLQGCKLCLQAKDIRPAPSIWLHILVLCERLALSVHRLVQGHTLQAVIEAVQKRVRKHRGHPDKLAEVRKWLWRYTRHVAHGLAQVGSRLGRSQALGVFPCICMYACMYVCIHVCMFVCLLHVLGLNEGQQSKFCLSKFISSTYGS